MLFYAKMLKRFVETKSLLLGNKLMYDKKNVETNVETSLF